MDFGVTKQYDRRPIQQKVAFINHKDDPPVQTGDEYFQTKYSLVLQLAADFWSNNAQLPAKQKQAEKMVRSYMFKDMLPLVQEIKLETTQDEVLKLCSELEKLMLGD